MNIKYMSRMDRDKIVNARAARNNLDMSQSLYIIILNQIHVLSPNPFLVAGNNPRNRLVNLGYITERHLLHLLVA